MVDMPGMHEGTSKIRRGKRTDFPHWRRPASDPSLDFYIAEREGTIRRMVLVCYIRELSRPDWRAILDIMAPVSVQRGISRVLLDFAKERARKRGGRELLMRCAREHDEERGGFPLLPPRFHPVSEVLSSER